MVDVELVKDHTGTDTVQISDKDGFVFMHFEHPVEWCKLDPHTGAEFAEAFARACYKAVNGDTPTTGKKSQITEQIRLRVIKRVELMLRSMASEVNVPAYKVQAEKIVDIIMGEFA